MKKIEFKVGDKVSYWDGTHEGGFKGEVTRINANAVTCPIIAYFGEVLETFTKDGK